MTQACYFHITARFTVCVGNKGSICCVKHNVNTDKLFISLFSKSTNVFVALSLSMVYYHQVSCLISHPPVNASLKWFCNHLFSSYLSNCEDRMHKHKKHVLLFSPFSECICKIHSTFSLKLS